MSASAIEHLPNSQGLAQDVFSHNGAAAGGAEPRRDVGGGGYRAARSRDHARLDYGHEGVAPGTLLQDPLDL